MPEHHSKLVDWTDCRQETWVPYIHFRSYTWKPGTKKGLYTWHCKAICLAAMLGKGLKNVGKKPNMEAE